MLETEEEKHEENGKNNRKIIMSVKKTNINTRQEHTEVRKSEPDKDEEKTK